MDARSHGVRCQSTCPPDLVVAKAHHLPHQEHVAIELGQRGERFVDREVDVLRRQPSTFLRQCRWLGVPQALAVVIEREVPGDVKQPGPDVPFRRNRNGRAGHSQEDILREITRRVGANRPAEVLEQAVLVGGEERFRIDGHCLTITKNAAQSRSSRRTWRSYNWTVSGRPISFGSHQLDLDAAILRRGCERCVLQSQPLRLLTFLIERHGEVVTREEIREQLWSDTVVEYDQGINFAIRQIRIALGPDAHLVQTVPRHGYRFVGELMQPMLVPARPSRRSYAIAAAVLLALASGFGVGIVTRDAPAGRFVYDHLVHPERCPYFRLFLQTHRNS